MRLFKKLSHSPYSKHYIFKGRFLLSNVIGVNARSTVDIDFLFHRITLSEETVRQQLKDILTDSNGKILFVIKSIITIKIKERYN